MQGLDGQVAIVTGGAQGIGFGIATVLRAEGANVVVADVDGAAAEAAASALSRDGEHALAVQADVTDPGFGRAHGGRGGAAVGPDRHPGR